MTIRKPIQIGKKRRGYAINLNQQSFITPISEDQLEQLLSQDEEVILYEKKDILTSFWNVGMWIISVMKYEHMSRFYIVGDVAMVDSRKVGLFELKYRDKS
jgi:hypothetical protein